MIAILRMIEQSQNTYYEIEEIKKKIMALENMFFWTLGLSLCFLGFYIRVKNKLPLIENNRELIFLIVLLISLLLARVFIWNT